MFAYPAKAVFNRTVPKAKIYANAKVTRSVKDKFVSQVGEIIWKYKLSPETTNLSARDGYTEIQVFELNLKAAEISKEILKVIDKAIPYPILFQLRSDDKIEYVAAYKHPAESVSDAWLVEEYFETGWLDVAEQLKPLPIALDIKSLYEQIIAILIDVPRRNGEALEALVARTRTIRTCRRELEILTAKLNSEKQFNRKVELNAQIRELNNQIAELMVR
ncbi:MAG TPA: DUF4391 domain-containing protein [Nitrospirota bacterium]|nr:DUF4391 domain-containing protein [Nitrospirota bacterium]